MSRTSEPPASGLESSAALDVQRVLRATAGLGSRFRVWLARLSGVRIGQGVTIEPYAQVTLTGTPARRGNLGIGDDCEVCSGALMYPWGGSIELAGRVHVGPGVVIYGHGGVSIGDETLLGPGCRLISSNHTVPSLGIDIRSQPDVLLPLTIGRDVWLGAGVTVLGGVTIEDGAVVGAGAVVTGRIPAGSVAYGNPARVARTRERQQKPK